jgi:hypothetical protein
VMTQEPVEQRCASGGVFHESTLNQHTYMYHTSPRFLVHYEAICCFTKLDIAKLGFIFFYKTIEILRIRVMLKSSIKYSFARRCKEHC